MEIKGKEIKPLTSYIFVREKENTYVDRTTDTGIILLPGMAHAEADGAVGRLEALEQIIRFAEVLAVGEGCKTLQVGDEVYYDVRSVRPLPIGKLDVQHLPEQSVIAYIR